MEPQIKANKHVFLLSGVPGCGKTTAIRKIIDRLPHRAGGFYTQEIREGGRRKGFMILTLDGKHGVLAHVSIRGQLRIGKYGVNLTALDSIGVNAIQRALTDADLVVIDEIGPMELLSRKFREIVWQVLDSEVLVVASIVKRSSAFTDAIKARPDVTVLEITRENREDVVEKILSLINGSDGERAKLGSA
jgi:nucleoside-triphosphatase